MLLRSRVAVFAPRKARVEIIPLIDVIFFLLATFVLFTLSMDKLHTLALTLPVGGSPSKAQPDIVSIQLSADGAVFWNRELIDAKEVPARLEHYKVETDEPRVMISADERAKFGEAIAVFDQVRQSGIAKVSIETKPRPTAK
ncbi:MAG TPA: biopolymer transporter ExbD [Lacunisphaera sp.]|nr:biopolymer transporter ExbD [Lacunisphaera sp.]